MRNKSLLALFAITALIVAGCSNKILKSPVSYSKENILDTKNNQKSSIDAFLTQVNRLKDMHWFISFIILNQLNDNILQRIDNPKQHKPKESDSSSV